MMDVVVVGGGIAGLSCASEIAKTHRVTLIERERALGYHSTGRSAAVYIEPYLEDLICRLTQLSRVVFESRQHWQVEGPLLRACGDMRLSSALDTDQDGYLERWLPMCPGLVRVDSHELGSYVPGLASAGLVGVWNPNVFHIDVHALSEAYRRALKSRGGQIHTTRECIAASHGSQGWTIQTSSGALSSTWLVNAAGAWADDVAEACGIEPLGLQPRRRTMVQVPAWDPSVLRWPMVHDAAGGWYLKPDGQRVLLSPVDETPVVATDARPDDHDVALAIHRIEETFAVTINRVLGRWAGLRTFAPDNLPVIGREPAQPYFLWCAGQGGYGIQTSPALSLLTHHSLTEDSLPHAYESAGIDLPFLGPQRLRTP